MSVSSPAAPAAAGLAPPGMSAEELDCFAANYYRCPQPELIPAAIEGLGPSGFAKDRANVFAGFFAEVFAANPGRVAEWRKLAYRQGIPTVKVIRSATELSRRGAILELGRLEARRPGGGVASTVKMNDLCWGAFFASGNPAYLRRLVKQMAYIRLPPTFWTGATAMSSLAMRARQDPLVRATLEAIRSETDPATRSLVDDVLTKDQLAISEEIRSLRDRGFRRGGVSTIDGLAGGNADRTPAEFAPGYRR